MTKPINLAKADVPMNHQGDWEILRNQVDGNPDFAPLEVKAFYIYGLIYDICQSVDCLLAQENAWPDLYLPAYAIFASGIELMGRSLRGDETGSGQASNNLRAGYNYLANTDPAVYPSPGTLIVTTTSHHRYSIADLVALRHFTAHGQATNDQLPGHIDSELLSGFPNMIGNAMENYWSSLQESDNFCENLGAANIRPLRNRSAPIEKILRFFDLGSAGAPFYNFDWSVKFE